MVKKIILFGGTFDPIHLGHIEVAEYSLEYIGADKVVFIPAFRSPHKELFPVATGQSRVEMISLTIAGRDDFDISECELKRKDPSYTLDTIREFQTEYGKGCQFYWLIGADMLKDLPKWYKIDRLIDECNLSVMFRAGFPKPDFAEFVPILGEGRVKKLQKNLIPTPLIDISSTQIRQKLAAGADVSDVLDEKVFQYIRENSLYGS